MGLYANCPYFKAERKRSITCEDTIRQYEKKEKRKIYHNLCCGDWKSCSIAKRLNAVYNVDCSEKEKEELIMEDILNAKSVEINRLMTKNSLLHKKVDELKKELTECKAKIEKMDKVAAANHNLYQRTIRRHDKIEGALQAECDWLKDFAGALLIQLHPGETDIRMTSNEVYSMMMDYDLQVERNYETGDWVLHPSKRTPQDASEITHKIKDGYEKWKKERENEDKENHIAG